MRYTQANSCTAGTTSSPAIQIEKIAWDSPPQTEPATPQPAHLASLPRQRHNCVQSVPALGTLLVLAALAQALLQTNWHRAETGFAPLHELFAEGVHVSVSNVCARVITESLAHVVTNHSGQDDPAHVTLIALLVILELAEAILPPAKRLLHKELGRVIGNQHHSSKPEASVTHNKSSLAKPGFSVILQQLQHA
eukprot:3940804-Rhodomonas_salina.1